MSRVPKLRHHKPSGRAVVTLNGKDHYVGEHGTKESKQAYARLIAEWQSVGRGLSFGIGSKRTTIAMLICDYTEYCEGYYPRNGRNSKTDQIRYATENLKLYYDTMASEFSPLKLKAVREQMLAAEGKHGKRYARSYINEMVSRIARMFKWAVANELIEPKVYAALKAVEGLKLGRCEATEPDPVLPVEDKIVEATLPHCSPTVATMIKLQLTTGMRPAEVCGLTPAMIDRSEDTWVVTLKHHKAAHKGKSRHIFLGPVAQGLITKYLLRDKDTPLFSPAEADSWRREQLTANRTTDARWGNNPGSNRKDEPQRRPRDAYTTDSYRRSIHYACARVWPVPEGGTKAEASAWRAEHFWSPNQLRHSAATKIRKLFGIEGAQVTLGHSSLNTTEIYAEKNREKGIQIAQAIG